MGKAGRTDPQPPPAMLIINADDWGRSIAETNAAHACHKMRRITSASAMVFMADSERAAELARETKLDVGLHLNLTEPFTGRAIKPVLQEHHYRVVRYLKKNKYAQLMYNPFLKDSLACVYEAQAEEFHRLYGQWPIHVDGHHHMHLCTNMVLSGVVPAGMKMRRNFSFWAGEKGLFNRAYRNFVDRWLARHYRLPDYFFCLLQCIEQNKWERVESLSHSSSVELMSHPVVAAETEYLMGGKFASLLERVHTGTYASL
jgi:chitin disaccharide deacetylase